MKHEEQDNQEIEQLLSRQRLRKPSVELDRRVSAECRPAMPASLKLSRWLAAAAAVMLVSAAVWPLIENAMRPPATTPPPFLGMMVPDLRSPWEPEVVTYEQSWSQVTPGPVVYDAASQPYRPYFVQTVKQESWIEEDGSEITLTYPESNVYYASLDVY